MAEGTEVAKGYISISPSMEGFRAKLQKEMSKITADIANATGKQYGQEFSSATAAGVKSAGSQVERAADSSGKAAGAKLGTGLTTGAKTGATGASRAIDGIATDAESRFSRMGDTLKAVLTTAGAAAGAAISVAVMESMSREVGTDRVAAALGLSPADAQRVASVSADIYKGAWGESTDEVNAALQSVMLNIGGMATASDEDLMRVTTTALDLANAFGVDLTTATGAVGTMMRTGMAPDAQAAFDIITAGFQAGVDKRGDFLDTLVEYSIQFEKLGIDGATATGLLSQGLEAGARDADKVADALKELSIRAIDGSQASAEAFALLGLNGEEMGAAFAAGGESASGALQLVLDRLRGMDDPVARSAAAVGLFGAQSEDLGDALFALDPSSAVSALGQVGGAADQMGQTLNDNAATEIEGYKRSIQDLGQQLVEKTGTFGAITAAALSFAPALGSVVGPAAQVVTAMTGIRIANIKAAASMVASKAAMIASNAIYLAKVGILGAVTIAQWALNAAMSANPIMIVVLAIAALVAGLVLLYQNNETVREVIDKVWNAIKGAIGAVVDWFKEYVPQIWEQVKEKISTVMDAIKAVIDTVMGIIRWIWENVLTKIWTAVQLYFDFVKAYVTTVINIVKAVISAVLATIQWIWDNVLSKLWELAQSIFDGIKNTIATIMDGIRSAIETALGIIQWVWDNVFGKVWNIATTAMENVRTGIDTALEKVKGLFSGAVEAIGQIWTKVTEVVKQPINAMFDWINRNMIRPINNVLGKFSDAVKLGELPTFHSGGYTGDQIFNREGVALLRNDEFVLNPQATSEFRGLAEAMNSGRGREYISEMTSAAEQGYGIGGPLDFIGDILAAGARAAIDFVANPVLDLIQRTFGGSWAPDVVIGGARNIVDGVKKWATGHDESTAGGYSGAIQAGNFTRPANGPVTSEYGPRWGGFHAGIDIGAPMGAAIRAIANGRAIATTGMGWNGGYGNMVTLDHGGGFTTRYAHASALAVRLGQIVRAGQQIAAIGSTGDSTGPHLHFETRFGGSARNPRSVLPFDNGGFLPPGLSMAFNGTGKPEPVLTDKQWKAMSEARGNVYNFDVQATQVPTESAMIAALRRADVIYGSR